jgi:F-type H+-transporting ATPase subunit delta
VSTESVARRYARAVFELGKETGELEAVYRDVTGFGDLYAVNAELRQALGSPRTSDEARDRLLADLGARLHLSPTASNLLRLLGRRRRLTVLPELVRQLGELVDEHQGIVRAKVRSAGLLGASYLERLRRQIEQATGKKVIIAFEQDPTLIAGVVTQIGDRVVDGSIRGKLDKLRESLRQT